MNIAPATRSLHHSFAFQAITPYTLLVHSFTCSRVHLGSVHCMLCTVHVLCRRSFVI